jgi:hypothetical protein
MGEPGDTAWAVTASDDGFLAVGGIDRFPEASVGIVWTSPDGESWDRQTIPNAFLTGVAAGQNGYTAAGISDEATREEPNNRFMAVWASTDGRLWEKTRTFDRGNSLHPVDIAPYGSGFVAAGVETLNLHDLIVMTSSDGTEWQRTSLGKAGGFLQAEWPVVAISENQIVIGGLSGEYEYASDENVRREWNTWDGAGHVAYSQDGQTWARVSLVDEDCPRPRFKEVTGTPTGFIAVGTCEDRAAVWTSETGEHWRRVSTGDPLFAGAAQTVHADQHGIVVIGPKTVIWTYSTIK